MGSPVINGQTGAFIQPRRWGRSESGNFESYFYHGRQQDVAAQAQAWTSVPGLAYEVTESFGGLSRLEIKFPWNQDGLVPPSTDFIQTWEFFGQEHDKDLLESQDNGGLVASLTMVQKAMLRELILNPPNPENNDPRYPVVQASFQQATDAGANATNAANALTLYGLMQSGMRSYLMPSPALRRTFITSSAYALAFALTNVKKILTTSYVLNFEGVPTGLLFNINAYMGGDVSSDPLLEYGWWKGFPTIQQIALLKWQCVQEWRYGWWPKAVYGAALTP